MMRRKRQQSGFALLLTLVLLMIAVVALAQVARQSAGEALHALDAGEELQRRWAVTSSRATLLPRAVGVLNEASGTDWRVSCELSGMPFELVFTDEQAKYNPTAMGLLQVNGDPLVTPRQMTSVVRNLSQTRHGSGRAMASQVVLRPTVAFESKPGDRVQRTLNDAEFAVYQGYGQLFDAASAQELLGEAGRPGMAANLTCWGNGRLNINRAPKPVIEQMLLPILGASGATAFLLAREDDPGLTPRDWLNTITDVSPPRRALAEAMLVDETQAQGLWVVAHGRTRSWHTFSVREYISEHEREQASSLLPAARETDEEELPPDPLQRYDFAW